MLSDRTVQLCKYSRYSSGLPFGCLLKICRTLIDLPGLIQVGEDKEFVFGLVKDYMANPRSLILAVTSGRNDWSNQAVLDLCRKIDKGASRTVGIITKPDAIADDDISNWVDLAQNKRPDVYTARAWHMLRNRSPEESHLSFKERNEAEKAFFSKGKFAKLSRDGVGIDTLRTRLSKLLFQHLVQELPSVKREIDVKLQDTREQLEQIGERRTTIPEQRIALTQMAQDINGLLRAAIAGHYADGFFGNMNMDAAPDSDQNVCRFRAAVQHLNMEFASTMRAQGRKYIVGSGPGDDEAEQEEERIALKELNATDGDALGFLFPKPKEFTRKESIMWVQKMLVRSRGAELMGNFNPALVGSIFQELSTPWEAIALEHITRVASICRNFVHKVVESKAPGDFVDRLVSKSVDTALNDALKNAKCELKKLMADNRGPPMTYSASWTTSHQKSRQRRHVKQTQKALRASTTYHHPSSGNRAEVDPIKLEKEMSNDIEKDMDK